MKKPKFNAIPVKVLQLKLMHFLISNPSLPDFIH